MGPALLAFHNIMDMIGIIPSIVMMVLMLMGYFLSIDIYIFCFRRCPEVKSLPEIVSSKGGKFMGIFFNI